VGGGGDTLNKRGDGGEPPPAREANHRSRQKRVLKRVKTASLQYREGPWYRAKVDNVGEKKKKSRMRHAWTRKGVDADLGREDGRPRSERKREEGKGRTFNGVGGGLRRA